jgi:diphthamide biosynthesis protein 2
MRRYAVMQRARDADVFGILVGTLGVGTSFHLIYIHKTHLTRTHIASYLPLITSLRTLLSSHRRKHYTINVGKLNPAKLANFSEVECWVLVACSENGVVESKVCIQSKFRGY